MTFFFSQALSEQLCDAAQKSAFVEANRQSSYNPKLPDGKSYNAKDAMDARHLKLHEVCNKYGDPMIPEYMMQSHVPPSTSFVIYPKEKLASAKLNWDSAYGTLTPLRSRAFISSLGALCGHMQGALQDSQPGC